MKRADRHCKAKTLVLPEAQGRWMVGTHHCKEDSSAKDYRTQMNHLGH